MAHPHSQPLGAARVALLGLLPACTFSVHWGGDHASLGPRGLGRATAAYVERATPTVESRPAPSASAEVEARIVQTSSGSRTQRPTRKNADQLAAKAAQKPRPAATRPPKRTAITTQPTLVSTVSVAPPRPAVRNPPAANPVRPQVGDNEAACYAGLRRAGIGFEQVAKSKAAGVAWPIILAGDVAGLEVKGGGKKTAKTNYLDCRLAHALIAWAPSLRSAGVTGIQHYSMYRAGARVAGSGKVSSHAHGLSIDVARFYLADGTSLSVLEDWGDRDRGEDPCTRRPQDGAGAKLMRDLVCQASALQVFQTVITPHYNADHDNHVHLEVSTTKSSPWIR